MQKWLIFDEYGQMVRGTKSAGGQPVLSIFLSIKLERHGETFTGTPDPVHLGVHFEFRSMAKGKAISLARFVSCFDHAWMVPRGLHRRVKEDDLVKLPWRIGLAVSGGADSMALAYLCRQMELVAKPGAIAFTAFVVDHRARKESSQEARKVAGWLSKMGIETKILELDWSSFAASKDPSVQNEVAVSMPTAFETHARRLRFQALGKACRERKTETLLLGHHADDSVETTIWRLSAGARGPGLAGIPEMARIPECHGIFGVSESGSSITLPAEADASSSRVIVRLEGKNRGTISFVPDDQKPSFASIRMTQNPSSIATGGIFLCRPLLSFHKESLVATCKENNVPFVDDPTNFDPTLTVRNAIRSLLSSNSLPRALQPPSVLSLIRSNQSLLQFSHELTNQLLHNQCHILELNPRAGTMIIEFTQHTTWEDSSEFSSPSRRQQIQCMALRRITEILSPAPTNRYPLQSFESYISRVFHDHNDSGCPDSTSQSDYLNTRRPFTVGGVMFNPLTVKLASKTSKDGSSLERNIWLLSRQPFMKNRETELRVNVPIPNPPLSAKSTTSPTFTPWTLWDDRFWLRFSIVPKPVRNLDESALPKIDKIPLIIRPFQKADLERIRTDPGTLAGQDGSKNWRRVQPLAALIANQTRNLLASHAPGLTRFTIPILALGGPSDPGQTDDADSEHLLALPTIGHHLSGRRAKSERMNPKKLEMFYAGRWWVVEWEWMYKMIDTEALHLMGKSIEAGAYGTHEKI